jgi:hypothetical protein
MDPGAQVRSVFSARASGDRLTVEGVIPHELAAELLARCAQ